MLARDPENFFSVLIRNKIKFLVIAAMIFSVAVIATYNKPVQYTAEAMLTINNKPMGVRPVSSVDLLNKYVIPFFLQSERRRNLDNADQLTSLRVVGVQGNNALLLRAKGLSDDPDWYSGIFSGVEKSAEVMFRTRITSFISKINDKITGDQQNIMLAKFQLAAANKQADISEDFVSMLEKQAQDLANKTQKVDPQASNAELVPMTYTQLYNKVFGTTQQKYSLLSSIYKNIVALNNSIALKQQKRDSLVARINKQIVVLNKDIAIQQQTLKQARLLTINSNVLVTAFPPPLQTPTGKVIMLFLAMILSMLLIFAYDYFRQALVSGRRGMRLGLQQ